MAVVPSLALLRAPSPQRGLMLVVTALLVVASIPYSLKIWQGPTRGETGPLTAEALEHRSAFLRWYPQIRELNAGVDIYAKYNYPNPPIMALILSPLTWLPPVPAALCWFYLKVAMTLLTVHWLWWLVQGSGRPFPPWAQLLTLALALRPILADLSHGNINLFILFLVVGALVAFASGHDWLSGTILGLAIACKVTPALFLPYLMWKRAWKCLAGCGVGLILFLLVIPAGFLGESENYRDLSSWVDSMVRPFVVEGKVFYSEHNNQSLPGLLARLATHSPSFTKYEGNDLVPLCYHNLTNLDPILVGWVTKLCFVGFLVLAALSCRPTSEPRTGWRVVAEWSLVILGMLLFSERTWKHHCVTLLLPFGVIAYYLATFQLTSGMRRYLIGTLVLVVLLMTATGTLHEADGNVSSDLGKLAQVFGAYVWAFFLLTGALVAILRMKESPPVAIPALKD